MMYGRIDELGRLLIPKELRQEMRVDSCSKVEIITNSDHSITIRKAPLKGKALIEEAIDNAMDLLNGDMSYTSEEEQDDAIEQLQLALKELELLKE